jgi:Flp pilus assembly protein TadB
MIGLSHVALAGALMACVAGIGGFAYGVNVGSAQEKAAQKRADDAAEAERAKRQAAIDASTEQHQAAEYDRQANTREITREVATIIERPVYRSTCLDADGVRLLDRAAAVANGESIGEPSGTPAQAAEPAAQ